MLNTNGILAMGVERWILVVGFANIVLGQERPDITMLYKPSTYTCVAGSNTLDYGVTLMSEDMSGGTYDNDFEYKGDVGYSSTQDCNFEETNTSNQCYTQWLSNYITLRKSGSDPIFPITDARWNTFDIHRTIGKSRNGHSVDPKYENKYEIQNKFFIGISVRSTNNAHILLCETDNPREGRCYWIIIDGFTQQFDQTGIRKCVKGVPDKYASDDYPDCKMLRNTTTEGNKLLSQSKWTHFMLSREDSSIQLSLWDLNTETTKPLLVYTDDYPLPLSYMYVRSYNAVADWKIHQYQYLILKEKSLIKLGPVLNFAVRAPICVSLFVAMCPECKMEIKLENQGIDVQTQTIQGDPNRRYMTWKNIRLEGGLSASLQYDYILYASLSTTDDSKPTYTFWAIDDFRKCTFNEIRVASTYSSSKLVCQSLKYSDWTFNLEKQVADYSKIQPPMCPNELYIGQNCNISCFSVIPTDGCAQQRICSSVQEGDNTGACVCGAGDKWGYYGDCNTACRSGYYGYDCKNQCGNCIQNNCYRNIGECIKGCKDGYLPPKCDTSYPRLKNAPDVIAESYTDVTVQFNDISIEGPEDLVYSVILECKKMKLRNWFNCSEPFDLIDGMKVPIENLEKETSYYIRAVVNTKNGYAYRNEDVPKVEAETTCKRDIEINIFPSARSATISFEESAESCSISNYIIELRQDSSTVKTSQYASQNMTLQDLVPYTNYKIIVTNSRDQNYINNLRFTTKEDAPGEIENLKILSTTETEVILSWEEPKEKNRVIRQYIVTYELHQRINCTSIIPPGTPPVRLIVPPSHISSVILSGLQPYSIYSVTIVAVTILPGNPKQIQFSTKITNAINEDDLPESITVLDSELKDTSVTIRWESNCVNQRGPLLFKIVLKCVEDEWCNHIEDINLMDINSLTGGTTTYSLTPFTHYKIDLWAKRFQDDDYIAFNRRKEIFSPASSPPAVRNFTIYSKSEVHISFRWLDPYPPHGNLENFKINYCYITNWGCKSQEINKDNVINCDLWDTNFNCYTLTNLYSKYKYTITITAKNKENRLRGTESKLTTNTVEERPSAPLNLKRMWEGNELKLFWNHPDITNGQIKRFLITLTQNGTELTNQEEQPFYSFKYDIPEENKTYMYQINKTFRYSSSYVLTICAVNTYGGENATLHIDTSPETPELTADVTIDEERTTTSTVTIIVPVAKKNTKSKNSFLYVVVSKIGNRISNRQTVQQNTLEEEILNYATSQNSWIAIERELNEEDSVVIIGDESQTNSDNLNKIIYNKILERSSTYDVAVVLMNLYREQKSMKLYRYRVQTRATEVPSSAGLYALFLLLLLPLVGYFVYRYFSKEDKRRTSMMMILSRLRATHSEDEHEYEVISLADATNEPTQTNLKKPVTASKPGPSSTQSAEHVAPPPELSAITTNLFHSRMVLLENLEDYLKEALVNGELAKQHALFPRGQTRPCNYGKLEQNKFKNRYNNLIAYDKNRVKLEKINNDQYSDYINASYIHGYRTGKAYIATQGSKLATVNDFWRMVWQEKVQYIVMLGNGVETGKTKFEKYWPEIDSSREYGFVNVYFEHSEVYADYEFRTFKITCKGETRKVTQLHYTSWPDDGVPLYPQSLVPFLKKMLTFRQNAPVVVHCSARVERTGTIILCDMCLRMAAREKAVDVVKNLREIREQRVNMVDNIDQYKLVHMVLLECLLAPDTTIPCNAEMSNAIQKLIEEGGLQTQLHYLQQSSWQDEALNFASPKKQNPANNSKNRFQKIVPCENQVYISQYPVDDVNSDYINAVPVDGFRFKEQFIVTQTPMPNTVKDFWRMVAEKSVKIIVLLNDIPRNDETSCIFWPSDNREMKPVPHISLTIHKIQSYDYYDIHSVILENKSSQETTMIKIVQFKKWKHNSKLPENEENLVMLWKETQNLSHGNSPMVVTCYDGATASGFFVAMSFVIEKIKLEQQCDPCLAVRVIRRNRKQFVSHKTQFEFLYRAAIIYLSLFETYSNFHPVVLS